MIWFIVKVLITSVLIVTISEIGKRNSFLGSLLASIPLVSVLGMMWMKIDKTDVNKIIDHSIGVFWLVLPSLPFFLIFPLMLKKGINFWISLILSLIIMICLYFLSTYILKLFSK